MMPERVRLAGAALRRFLTPFRIPDELRTAMGDLQRAAAAAKRERERLDEAMLGAQASMITGVLSHHDRFRGPRDV